MKQIRRFIMILAGAAALSCASPPFSVLAAAPITLLALPTSSGLFPYVVSIARALSTYCPDCSIIVTESRGNVDVAQQLRSGAARLAHSVAHTDYENYFGMGPDFEGQPFKDFRILWYYEKTLLQICVAVDSGIESIYELDGRPFCAGGTGTTASSVIHKAFDLLGIHPLYFEEGQLEAASAYTERTIDGVVKIGPAPDSYVTYLNSARPVRLLSFSDEDMTRIQEAFPTMEAAVVPMGAYKGVDGTERTLASYNGIQSDVGISQEQGYSFFKAMWEDGRAIWQRAYPLGAKNDVPAITLQAAKTPLHPGTVQYLVEHGYVVPENLIPAEYVPVR